MDPLPLSATAPGLRVRITAVSAKPVHKRLLVLGLPPGMEVTVLRNRGGAVVVGRRHDRLAIGHSLARQILVEETP